MGNKSTKPAKHAEKVNKDENKVELRKKKKTRERPMSAPPASEGQPEIDFTQFVMQRPGDKPIAGKGITGVQRELPVADYETALADEHPTGAQISIFERSIEQVLTVWPEYSPVKEITTKDLPSAVIETLTTIANRLYQQYNAIKKLSDDAHELKQINEELREERDAMQQLARKREVERNGLREDVGLLRGELKKRGLEVKLPSRHASHTAHPRDDIYDDAETPRSEILTPRSDKSSDWEDDGHKKKKDGGIYQPTPLVLAGVKSPVALQRVVSLRTPQSPINTHSGEDKWAWNETNAPDELKHRVKALQIALEREKKEKVILKDRLESHTPGSKRLHSKGTSEIYQAEFVDIFRRLQREAFDKVRRQVSYSLPHVNVDKQQAFICSIMEISQIVARERVAAFMENMETLVLNPAKQLGAIHAETAKPKRSGSIMENVRKIELAQRQQGLNRQYGQRNSTGRLPDDLVSRLASFIEDTAEVTNISPLTSAVVDELQGHYPQCLTPSLLNQSIFTTFIHDCCRLSWRLCVVDPPYHVSTEATRFEKRYHETDVAVEEHGQEIDFFLWPSFFSRKHGDILSKGIVQLK